MVKDGLRDWEAALPREPWNWVCLEPQPTFIGVSDGVRKVKEGEKSEIDELTFAKI